MYSRHIDEENMEYQNKKEDSVLTLYVNLVILGVFISIPLILIEIILGKISQLILRFVLSH